MLNEAELILDEEFRDLYQELVNVAMGRAANLLARLLNTYIELPIPKVNLLARSELDMALASAAGKSNVSAVCQGFMGDGISGEALLLLSDADIDDLITLGGVGDSDSRNELELLMDTANVLIGACLKGFAEQLDIQLTQSQPEVLGHHQPIERLLNPQATWSQALAIEIRYRLEHRAANIELLLLFTAGSLSIINHKAQYLME